MSTLFKTVINRSDFAFPAYSHVGVSTSRFGHLGRSAVVLHALQGVAPANTTFLQEMPSTASA